MPFRGSSRGRLVVWGARRNDEVIGWRTAEILASSSNFEPDVRILAVSSFTRHIYSVAVGGDGR